jgi:hypothetical protein
MYLSCLSLDQRHWPLHRNLNKTFYRMSWSASFLTLWSHRRSLPLYLSRLLKTDAIHHRRFLRPFVFRSGRITMKLRTGNQNLDVTSHAILPSPILAVTELQCNQRLQVNVSTSTSSLDADLYVQCFHSTVSRQSQNVHVVTRINYHTTWSTSKNNPAYSCSLIGFVSVHACQ